MTATAMEMPAVSECTVTACSYNQNGCRAFAITVSGSNGAADCGTFIELTAKGGLPRVVSRVGACTRADCVYNSNLECTAPEVKVGPGPGDHDAHCLTYRAG